MCLRYLHQLARLRPTLPMNHRTHMYTKQARYSKATALGVNIKMVSESENRDADSASSLGLHPFHLIIMCGIFTHCLIKFPTGKMSPFCANYVQNENELNYELVQNLNGEL